MLQRYEMQVDVKTKGRPQLRGLTQDACDLMQSDVNLCVSVTESSQERMRKMYSSGSSLKHV